MCRLKTISHPERIGILRILNWDCLPLFIHARAFFSQVLFRAIHISICCMSSSLYGRSPPRDRHLADLEAVAMSTSPLSRLQPLRTLCL